VIGRSLDDDLVLPDYLATSPSQVLQQSPA
jgi:hypothetical protein